MYILNRENNLLKVVLEQRMKLVKINSYEGLIVSLNQNIVLYHAFSLKICGF